MKIYYSVYDYDSSVNSWVQIQEKMLINKSYDDLIINLINEFDTECGWGGIWKYARNDEEGRVTAFALYHKGSSREYIYEIIY